MYGLEVLVSVFEVFILYIMLVVVFTLDWSSEGYQLKQKLTKECTDHLMGRFINGDDMLLQGTLTLLYLLVSVKMLYWVQLGVDGSLIVVEINQTKYYVLGK